MTTTTKTTKTKKIARERLMIIKGNEPRGLMINARFPILISSWFCDLRTIISSIKSNSNSRLLDCLG